MTNEKKPYWFVRVRWFRGHDLTAFSSELSRDFTVVRPFVSSKDWYLHRELGSLLVRADTLYALLETDKATLYQKEAAPFTRKDLELRERIFKLYPHTLRAPAAFFVQEPPFEVSE